jgi:hypothetical protein
MFQLCMTQERQQMAEARLRMLLEDLVVRLRALAAKRDAVAVQSSDIIGAFVRVWQAGVVTLSGVAWNNSLAQQLKELGYHRDVPLLDLVSAVPNNIPFDDRVLDVYYVQLSILQGVVSVSGSSCLTSSVLGAMLNRVYSQVLEPSGLDENGNILQSLRDVGFGRF